MIFFDKLGQLNQLLAEVFYHLSDKVVDSLESIHSGISEIRGHGIKTVRALCRVLREGGLDPYMFQVLCWHEANTLRGYKKLSGNAVWSPRQYQRRYAKRVNEVELLLAESSTDGGIPLDHYRRWLSLSTDLQPFTPTEAHAPSKQAVDRLVALGELLSKREENLKKDYKAAFGKLSVARHVSLQMELQHMSHAACSRVTFGVETLCVIPWEVLELDDVPVVGVTGQYTLEYAVESFIVTNKRYANLMRRIEARLGTRRYN